MKKFLTLTVFLLLSFYTSFAQVPPPPDYQENAGPGAPSATPVDQYWIVLIGIALTFGVYFIYNKRKAFN